MDAKRRIDVMLSSTFIDLVEHRETVIASMNGLLLTPLAQEFDAATDSDLIKESLERVERADVYVGIIGLRYGQRPVCPIRNPDRLSLTELEYRCAVRLQLPRLMFISGPEHLWPQSYVELSKAEGDEGLGLRQAFIMRVRGDRIAGEFTSPDHLKAQATTSFVALQKKLEVDNDRFPAAPTPKPSPSPDDFPPSAPPAFHSVRKPYVEKQGFAGRASELALIDQWATGTDAMLLFQAIGGMGKSMLTWHWLRTRAAAVSGDWAGRLWYSFYEQGADLNDFCVHSLAYIRHEPPKTFRSCRTLDLGYELRRELDARPWLLTLDGLERVLVAYNRVGKEHMSDEEAVVARDGMDLDRKPRDCFRPDDDDVLVMLAQAGCGKLLTSSRLPPSALMTAGHQPIPGVRFVGLEGLEPEDAERVLRNAGVRGDGSRMRGFLDGKLAGHPLSVGVVAGRIMTFLEARGDFDRWVEHPRGGADYALVIKDLRGRQNHILSGAFDDLDDDSNALLGSIAITNLDLSPDILCIINPKRPLEPKKVAPPKRETERELWLHTNDADIAKVYREWRDAKSPDERAVAQEKLNEFLAKNFAERKRLYDTYVMAHHAWQQQTAEADAWLERTLPELEARGLLQYDAENSSLDMHPAIRHTALMHLSPDARNSTCSHVSDALSSRPVKPFEEARSLEDLAVAVTRVHALNAAGKFKDGWNLFMNSGLKHALSRLYYVHRGLELLQPYFPQGWKNGPLALPEDEHPETLYQASVYLNETGESGLASMLVLENIKMRLAKDQETTATALGNLTRYLKDDGKRARGERARSLAIRLSEAVNDEEETFWLKANESNNHVERGRLGDAESILVALREGIISEKIDQHYEAQLLKSELFLAFRAGRLTEPIAEKSLNRIRTLGEQFDELWSVATIAQWRQVNEKHEAALNAFSDLIELGNEVGWFELPAWEARRARSLAALKREDEARRIAAKVDRGEKPPHVPLALLYLQLGDQAQARAHALAGYNVAWGEGPPHHAHWDLEDCRIVLAAVGEPEPVLPPFDPAKVEPFDFEPEVERLIEKTLAESAKKADEKAKRDAAREAEVAKKS